ncbi:MAG: M13 family metallopeptidase [Holophagaceae bacterium]|nr:M13 family metallopeptidase [Holophagaceae bacterium]
MKLIPILLSTSAALLAAEAAKPVIGVDPAYMDRAATPCVDFYAFANGTYNKVAIPAAYAAYGVNQEIDDRNWAILRDILESSAKETASPKGSVIQRIGDFYASGMDEAGIEKAGTAPLSDAMGRIKRIKDPSAIAPALAWLHRHGAGGGFAFFVAPDDKDSSSEIARLYQGGLGLPEREYYFRADDASRHLRGQYAAHIARIFVLAGDGPAAAAAAAGRVLALETRLAEASKRLADLRDPVANYHKLKRAEVAGLARGFDWAAYFKGIGLPDSQSHLLVGQPEFLKAFAKLTREAPLDDWKAYLRWNLLNATASELPRAFEEQNFAFYGATLSGRKEMLPRWKRVLQATDTAIGEDLGQLYVKRAFSPAAKARALEMVAFHKEAMRLSIQNSPWMSEGTKKAAFNKLDTMGAKVGYPDTWRDYSKLDIKRQPYVLNVLAARAFEFERRMAKLGRPVDRAEWGMTPQTNNAYYNPSLNEMAFPAGILQPPFFDEKADDAVNYGALASTIGHELTHGFDDQGRQYDERGNLKDWWAASDVSAFKERAELVVKQYDAYEALPGLRVNGNQSLGENIADVGGLKISYVAYKLASKNKSLKVIDGLTPDQRFFVAFAQGWRTNVRPESLRLQITSDVHCPIRFRVIGPVADLPEFYEAFGCKEGRQLPEAAVKSVW